MAQKIMLVEDDTNLSEIYKARMEAEGFQVISAPDGEAALALAVKEHPDLIISDVMMPKVSGFDMLDILRGTDGIKNTRVIMMTALGQSEDKARADKLGADRYLVKSQVTLEDVVKTVHEVLGDVNPSAPAATVSTAAASSAPASAGSAPASPAATAPAPPQPAAPSPNTTVTNIPVVAAPPVSPPAPVTASQAPSVNPSLGTSSSDEQSAVLSQIQDFVNTQEAASKPSPDSSADQNADDRKRVIEPIAEPAANLPKLDTPPETKPASNSVADPTNIAL